MIAYSIHTPAAYQADGWCDACQDAVTVHVSGEGERRCERCGSWDHAEVLTEDEVDALMSAKDDAHLADTWRLQIAYERSQGMAYQAQWREGVLADALATAAEHDETLREAIARVIAERDAEDAAQ
jgi:hypothetical protein